MALADRVTAIAVGIGKYKHLDRLHGPESDVESIRDLLVTNRSTGVLPGERFISLINVTSDVVRQTLTDYCMSRSARGDILLLYFSGHGVPLGTDDFGLCTVESRLHDGFDVPVSLSMVRFSEVVESLAAVKVDPVVILDACYSGHAGVQMSQVFLGLNRAIQHEKASSYALLCSSAKTEITLDLGLTSSFTKILAKVAREGVVGAANTLELLSLQDIFPRLHAEVEQLMDTETQLFLGESLPRFGLIRNSQFRQRTESLTKGHREALMAFWNNGQPRALKISELQKYGSTVHTTYGKLKYAPAWALLEDVDSKTRQLTQRGVEFIQGTIVIPFTIVRSADSTEWKAAPGTRDVAFAEI